MTPEFVLDCSVVLAFCFAEEGKDEAELIISSLEHGIAVTSPVFPMELTNGLFVGVRRNRIQVEEAERLIQLFSVLPIRAEAPLIQQNILELYELGIRHKLTAYDASYLQVAKRYNISIATFDAALRRAAMDEGLPQTNFIPPEA